jgi:hypothetical protein
MHYGRLKQKTVGQNISLHAAQFNTYLEAISYCGDIRRILRQRLSPVSKAEAKFLAPQTER